MGQGLAHPKLEQPMYQERQRVGHLARFGTQFAVDRSRGLLSRFALSISRGVGSLELGESRASVRVVSCTPYNVFVSPGRAIPWVQTGGPKFTHSCAFEEHIVMEVARLDRNMESSTCRHRRILGLTRGCHTRRYWTTTLSFIIRSNT